MENFIEYLENKSEVSKKDEVQVIVRERFSTIFSCKIIGFYYVVIINFFSVDIS